MENRLDIFMHILEPGAHVEGYPAFCSWNLQLEMIRQALPLLPELAFERLGHLLTKGNDFLAFRSSMARSNNGCTHNCAFVWRACRPESSGKENKKGNIK